MNPSPNGAVCVFWSHAGQSRRDPELDCGAAPENAGALALTQGPGFHRARLQCLGSGTLLLHLGCPRPLRIWVDGRLGLDEHIAWRSFQRELRAAAIVPVEAGEVDLLIEVGPRPRHPRRIDLHCPSRSRQRLMSAVLERFPDVLSLDGTIEPGRAPAISLRFTPSQFFRDGVAWQQVLVRPLREFSPQLSSDHVLAIEQSPAILRLRSEVLPYDAVERTTDAHARVGLRRFFVPVSEPANAPPALREEAVESRLEPEIEVARMLRLSVEGEEGTLALSMPGFESLGRLAPHREYHEFRTPSIDELRPDVPKPILPEEWAALGGLYDAAWEMLLTLTRRPAPDSGLPNGYLTTSGGGFHHYVFVWDSSFTAMASAYAWRALDPGATLDVLYSRQFDGGYIHREVDVRDGMPVLYEPDFSPNPPLLAIAEWKIACLRGDRLRLRRVYPALLANHRWIKKNRRLDDGTYWTTGLANGLDNSPSLGEGYPDLTAQMAHAAETLATIATLLGLTDDADELRRGQLEIGAALNRRLWDESAGIYSTSLADGGHNPNKVVTAFWPLWAGIVPPDRVESLARHLTDPRSFARHHPVPSLAADSPHYQAGGDYWRGSTWAPTNYATIKGFARAGRWELARATALRHLQVMEEVRRTTGKIWENYAPDASRPGSVSQPDYSWSALGPIALLLEVVIGLEPDATRNAIAWTPPPGERVGVDHYPLGPATICLLQEPNGERHRYTVRTDSPVTLEITTPSGVSIMNCRIGKSELDI